MDMKGVLAVTVDFPSSATVRQIMAVNLRDTTTKHDPQASLGEALFLEGADGVSRTTFVL